MCITPKSFTQLASTSFDSHHGLCGGTAHHEQFETNCCSLEGLAITMANCWIVDTSFSDHKKIWRPPSATDGWLVHLQGISFFDQPVSSDASPSGGFMQRVQSLVRSSRYPEADIQQLLGGMRDEHGKLWKESGSQNTTESDGTVGGATVISTTTTHIFGKCSDGNSVSGAAVLVSLSRNPCLQGSSTPLWAGAAGTVQAPSMRSLQLSEAEINRKEGKPTNFKVSRLLMRRGIVPCSDGTSPLSHGFSSSGSLSSLVSMSDNDECGFGT